MTPPLADLGFPLRTRNRFALVSAIRHSLRRRGLPRPEVERFCSEALAAQDVQVFEAICREWLQRKTGAHPEPA
jgi:hypothetical protein